MREKTFTYDNNEYKVTLEKDRYGLQILSVYKKKQIFGFSFWSKQNDYLWDTIDKDKNMNPVEFAIAILKVEERRKNEEEEYEKKLDEWFK